MCNFINDFRISEKRFCVDCSLDKNLTLTMNSAILIHNVPDVSDDPDMDIPIFKSEEGHYLASCTYFFVLMLSVYH